MDIEFQGELKSTGKTVIGSLHQRKLVGGIVRADIFKGAYDLYHNHVDTEVDPDTVRQFDGSDNTPSGWPKGHGLKDHDIAKLKNELRDCAVKYHAAEQLRSRLGTVLGRYIK